MSYRPKTIEEKGGIQLHLQKLDIDFKLFSLLHQTVPRVPDTTIADILSLNRPKKISRHTIKHWRAVLDKEQTDDQNNTVA